MKLASAGESRLFDVVDPTGAPVQSEAEKQAVNKYETNRRATSMRLRQYLYFCASTAGKLST